MAGGGQGCLPENYLSELDCDIDDTNLETDLNFPINEKPIFRKL